MDEWTPVFQDVYDPLKAGSIDATDTEPHDHGIRRAMRAKYKPNKDIVGDPHKTLFVARLNPKTNENTLEQVFSKYGAIKKLKLIRDIVTGFSRCYGFVEYEDNSSAELAFWRTSKLEIDGCEIFVDHECERILKGWVPRRLGGGLGGKKESGQLRFGGRDRPFRKPINYYMKSKQNFDKKEDNYSKHDGRTERLGHDSQEKERDRYVEKRWTDRSRERTRESQSRARSRDSHRSDRCSGRSRKGSHEQSRDESRDRKRDRRRNHSRGKNREYSRERKKDRSRDRKRNESTERKKDERKESEIVRYNDRQMEEERKGDISVDNFIRQCSEAVKIETPQRNATENDLNLGYDLYNQQGTLVKGLDDGVS